MDGLDLLKRDHDEVRAMFEEFEQAATVKHMRSVADRVVQAITQHSILEERAFYPELRRYAEDDLADAVLESLEEHGIVKRLCNELRDLDEDDERFEAKMKVLMDLVVHHLEEEENDLFPMVRRAISQENMRMIDQALEQAKNTLEGRASAPQEQRASIH